MKNSNSLLFWAPRTLGILAVLFISIFALDAFEPGVPLGMQLLAFLIHLIPSLILLSIVLIAWFYELIGGIILLLIGALLAPFIYIHNFRMNHSIGMSLIIVLIINIPFVITGGLFIWNHLSRKKI